VTDNLLNGRCRRNRPLTFAVADLPARFGLARHQHFRCVRFLAPAVLPKVCSKPSVTETKYALQLFERLAGSVGRPRWARGRNFKVTQKLRFASLLYKQLFETMFNFQIENLSSLSRRHSQTQILTADLQSYLFITNYYVICYEHYSSAFR